MIYINCKLNNMWAKTNFKNLYNATGRIVSNKYWEFEIVRDCTNLIGVEIDTHWRGHDHAGFRFGIVFLCHSLQFAIYDNRHWDYETRNWDKPTVPYNEEAYNNIVIHNSKQENNSNDIDNYNGA